MPIITMLDTSRSPVGRQPRPRGPLDTEPVAEPVARHHDLADDLARRQVAHQPLRPGVAERAVERAADLARQAQRAAVGLRDVDALDLVRPLAWHFAGQPQQPFACAVDRDLLGHDLGPRQRVMRVEHSPQLLRDAGHLREAAAHRAHRASATAAAPASCCCAGATPTAPSASASAARVIPTSDGLAGGT